MRPDVKIAYLDMQALVGSTKHMGGPRSSRALLEACHVAEAREVLDVGCGIGIEPVRIATTTAAHVVGLDISARMLAWADLRAREAGVRERIELVRGDVLDLPFASDRFDAVLCESVLAFVEDKEGAIRELVRVTRPGGYVGLNEGFNYTAAPDPRIVSLLHSISGELPTLGAWKALWAASGLHDLTVRAYRLDAARETRDRFRWLGLGWAVRVMGRAVRLYLTQPAVRGLFNDMFRSVIEKTNDTDAEHAQPVWVAVGYALLVGRK